MAERLLPVFTYDPEMLKRLCVLFQEVWAEHQGSVGAKQSSDDIRELRNKVAARILRETEAGDFDPARIKERALAGL
ncbi:MAG: hypothetical protein ABWZ27_04735 [Aestuariivirgaceae bacterium]|jgi:hypothetical protein